MRSTAPSPLGVEGIGQGRLLRSDGVRLRRSDHARISTRTPRPSGLPAEAVAASLGCGNPTALLALEPGQTVLDLGSGGGIDVLLSAKRVGPTGKVYGLDMTDEMLALARENQRKAGATNVEFLKGTIEAIPAARQLGRRHHLELRDQSVERQGRGAARGVPRAEAGRPVRRLRRRRARRRAGRHPAQHGAVGRAASPARSRRREYVAKLQAAGFSRRRSGAVARLQGRRCAGVPGRERRRRRRGSRRRSKGKFASAFIRARKPRRRAAAGRRAARSPVWRISG